MVAQPVISTGPTPPIPLNFYGFSGTKSGPNSAEVEDMPTNNRRTLPLTAG